MLVLADHGNLVVALPFVVPPLILVAGLLFLMVRDRRRGSAEDRPAAK